MGGNAMRNAIAREVVCCIMAAATMGMGDGMARAQAKPAQNAVSGAGSRLAVPADHDRRAASENGWLPATVPGDVHLDLLANKKIPDPFYRDNESKLQWIENESWEYQLNFEVAPALLARSQRGSGLRRPRWCRRGFREWRAQVLGTDNSFRVWRVPVKSSSARRKESAEHYFSITHQGRSRNRSRRPLAAEDQD